MVEITETRILTLALVLMLVPFGLIVWGVHQGITTLWALGLVLLVIGSLIPAASRYVIEDDEEETVDE